MKLCIFIALGQLEAKDISCYVKLLQVKDENGLVTQAVTEFESEPGMYVENFINN